MKIGVQSWIPAPVSEYGAGFAGMTVQQAVPVATGTEQKSPGFQRGDRCQLRNLGLMRPRTKTSVHQAAERLLLGWLSHSNKKAHVLDAPCGEGAFLERLKNLGFALYGLDLEPEIQIPQNGAIYRMWDLNKKPFPFENESFDAITSIEGIEHLENPFEFVREFNRLLKPGGCLVLTTPNILSIRSRVRFLGSGFLHKFEIPLNETKRSPSHHITPLSLPHLRYILHQNGFEIIKIGCSYVKPISFLYLIYAPWIALYTLAAFRKEHDTEQRQRNWQILKCLLSWPILLGEHLALLARKK